MGTMVVTNNGRNLCRDSAKGIESPQIFYVAIGTNDTAPVATDTALAAEAFRKLITSFANGASPGEVIANVYIGPDEAVGVNFKEVGVFGGSTVSSVANSGILLARGLYSPAHVKTNAESIIIPIDLIFT